MLPPADVHGPLTEPAAGPRRAPAAGLSTPRPPPPPPSLAPPPPVLAERNRKPVQPRLVVEETLGLGRGDPEPPQPRSFVVGDRIRLPSADVNQPPPLPILAQPTADRASLDDPTVDASAAAATAATMPQRTNAVPYAPRDAARPVRQPPTAPPARAAGRLRPPHRNGASADAVRSTAFFPQAGRASAKRPAGPFLSVNALAYDDQLAT